MQTRLKGCGNRIRRAKSFSCTLDRRRPRLRWPVAYGPQVEQTTAAAAAAALLVLAQNTNNKFKIAAKWRRGSAHKSVKARKHKTTSAVRRKRRMGMGKEGAGGGERRSKRESTKRCKATKQADEGRCVLHLLCGRRVASQSLKLKMKLKLKCQLEWNENDIKTEAAATAATTTMQQQQQQ